jgi:thiopurine S-methyltransferase
MDPDFWLERWRRGETGWHRGEINAHLREVWPRLGIEPHARVFVPLCGKTPDLLWLASQGHRVLGVELSRLAVDAFFKDNGLSPRISEEPPFSRHRIDEIELLCGDYFELQPYHLAGVAAVYDRASLIALPPPLRARYAIYLDALLPAAVPRLLITLEYDQDAMAGPPFAVQPDEVEALFRARHRVTPVAALDVIDDSPRFRERGLTRMVERVYRLDPQD